MTGVHLKPLARFKLRLVLMSPSPSTSNLIEAAKQPDRLLAPRAAKRSVGSRTGKSPEPAELAAEVDPQSSSFCRQLRRLGGLILLVPHAPLRCAWG